MSLAPQDSELQQEQHTSADVTEDAHALLFLIQLFAATSTGRNVAHLSAEAGTAKVDAACWASAMLLSRLP